MPRTSCTSSPTRHVAPWSAARTPRHLKRTAVLMLGLLLPLLPPTAHAQEALPDEAPTAVAPSPSPTAPREPLRLSGPLDFRSAWQAALANDPTLRAAQAGAQAGQAGLAVARAQWLPQVSLSASRQHNDLRTTSAPGVANEQPYYSGVQSLQIRQALWQPVQDAAISQADAQAEEGGAIALQTRQQLAVRLAEAFFEYLLADDQISLVQAQTAAHARQLAAAQKSFAAGNGTRTDIDEAQARLDMDAADALLAQQQRDRARLMLEQLVGVPVAQTVVLDPARFDATPPEPGELDDWLRLALRFSPELQALQARRDAAAAEVDKARARHQPTLELVVQHSRSSPESSSRLDSRSLNRSIGLQFNLPIYSGGGTDAAVRQSLAELQRHESQLAAQRLDLQLRVQQTHRSIGEGRVRVKALQQAVHSAEQLVRSVSRSYQAGVRTTVDVLNAEQQLAEARRNLSQTRLTTLLSLLRLRSLGGLISEVDVEQLDAYLSPPAATPTPAIGTSGAALNPAAAGG